MTRRPRVLLAATGGTIATVPSAEAGGRVPGQGAADLVSAVPAIAEVADLVPVDVCRVPSHDMTPAVMCQLAHLIADSRCDGAVVTHGTDTLEETAYALAVMLERRIPVVLTGAMRGADEPGADGPANLLAAVCAASTPEVAGLGPVVVVNDEIHLARYVTKTHTSRIGALTSPACGPAGVIAEGRVWPFIQPWAAEHLGLPQTLNRRVDLVWTAAGLDGAQLAVAREADGVVVAGTGGGHLPRQMLSALRDVLAAGRPVVLASRTGSGPVLTGTYGGPGSESDLRALGVLPAGDLSPVKARMRLLVALQLGLDPRRVFPRRL